MSQRCVYSRLTSSRGSDDAEGGEEDSADGERQPPQTHVDLKQPFLTIVDLKQQWMGVAVDVFLAACCLVPVLGLVSVLYLFFRYGKPELVTWKTCSGSQDRVVQHFLVWICLVGTPLVNVWTFWDHFHEGVRQHSLHLESILVLMQRTLLRDALTLGAGIAMIILEIQSRRIFRAVTKHLEDLDREGHLDDFSNEAGDEPSKPDATGQEVRQGEDLYKELKKRLEEKFPKLYKRREHSASELESEEWPIQIVSSLLTASLVFLLQVEETATFYLKPCEGCVKPVTILGREEPIPTSWTFIGVTCYVVCVTTYTWYHFIGLLNLTCAKMRRNHEQLLVFTALTRAGAFNMLWSSGNLKHLRGLREAWAKAEHEEWDEIRLRKALAKGLSTTNLVRLEFGSNGACLDLQKPHHAKAWWKLRMYIQIDFLDETVLVEIAGIIIFMVTVLFFVVSLLDWLRNHSWSLPLSLLSLLILTLLHAMYRVFQGCVAINTLWDNDNRALSLATLRATHSACMSADPKMHRCASFLRAMQNKVAVFENRQELFGFAVTRNLRNGWLLTVATVIMSFAIEIAEPLLLNGLLRGHLEGLLDLIDGRFNNAASE
eukprot:s633_g1.t1